MNTLTFAKDIEPDDVISSIDDSYGLKDAIVIGSLTTDGSTKLQVVMAPSIITFDCPRFTKFAVKHDG